VSLDRIQRALSAPAPLDFKEQTPVFRLEIVGRKPPWKTSWASGSGSARRPTADDAPGIPRHGHAQDGAAFGGFSGKYLLAQTALTLAETWR
jgi:hypothetical protein